MGSHTGDLIRKKVIENYMYTKEKFNAKGFRVMGQPCPIMIVFIGDEVICRIVSRLLMDNGVHVNGIE